MKCEQCNEPAIVQVGNDPGDDEQARLLAAILGSGPPPVMLCRPHADTESHRRLVMYGGCTRMEIHPTSGGTQAAEREHELMGQSTKLTAAKVRVEITSQEGVTYELQLDGPGVLAELGIEYPTVSRAAESGMWMETLPTGGATITLEASGKVFKSERRQS